LTVIAMLYRTLGLFAAGAGAILVALSLVTERAARQPMRQAGAVAIRAYQFGESVTRYAVCARTMGMGATLTDRWRSLRGDMLAAQNKASMRAVVLGAAGKCACLFFQSPILGLGAWLAAHDELSGGAIFAGSLLLGRALAPAEAIIGAWRPILAAKEALNRIRDLTNDEGDKPAPVRLPEPSGDVEMHNASWTPAGALRPAARGISMRIQAGAVLTIVGPSATGKSTVARLLAGALLPDAGVVRLDAPIWRPGTRGNSGRPSATCRRTSRCSPAPSATISPGLATQRMKMWSPPPRPRMPMRRLYGCRWDTAPCWTRRPPACPAARSSGSRWPEHCWATRRW
jgi:ABC-type protease/lipase transport system fused ATPase/permease subunit